MTKFGIREENYDALRVITGALPPGNIIGAGVLENKIYLWPSDSGQISIFDATQIGLIAALAAATSGDTVWLPSIPIALTAAITVPAGAALIGISDNAALSFSGFSGTAITLSTSSALIDCTVTMVSNGATAIGVEAEAEGAIVQHVRVTASGGATTNIAIGAGYPTAVVLATEAWLATGARAPALEDSIAWSTDYDSGDPHWHEVAALPVDEDVMLWAGMARDGSTLYAAYGTVQGVYGFGRRLYKCHNPKSATPTWEQILAYGTETSFGTIVGVFQYLAGPFGLHGNELHTAAFTDNVDTQWVVGSYDGSSWTWHYAVHSDTDTVSGEGYHAITMIGNTYVDGVSVDDVGQMAIGFEIYRSHAGVYYCCVINSGTLYLYGPEALGQIQALGSTVFSDYIIGTKISGAEEGSEIYCVSYFGDLWISTNGSTFTDTATWKPGFVRDKALAGGGTLAWTSIETINNGDPIGQLSTDDGATWPLDLTGDWWTAVASAEVNFQAVGFSLVFA